MDPYAESTDPASRPEAVPIERRRLARFPQAELHCDLGRVLDVSAAGMRVVCRKPPAGDVDVTLNTEFDPITVRAKVIWSRRLGLRKHETGMVFIDLSPEASRFLATLSTPDPYWNWDE